MITHKIRESQLHLPSLYALINEIQEARGNYERLRDRIDSIAGSTGLSIQSFITTIEQEQSIIDLPFSYEPGKHQLLVFRNGLLQAPGEGRDYLEVNNQAIQFTSPCQTGEVIYVLRLLPSTPSSSLPQPSPEPGQSSVEIKQVTKLGVVASPESPYTVDLPISQTMSFNRMPIEVLKFTPAETNVLVTLASFDNSDADDFVPDEHVIFDGAMKLKTEYIIDMLSDEFLEENPLWFATIDLSPFAAVESIEVV